MKLIYNNPPKSSDKNGFTLIELLVVIAIIAILAAILLPVLAKARDRAQLAQDLNNMKELAGGILTFNGDHNDCFPAAGWDNAGNYEISWDSIIYPYIGGGNGTSPNLMDVGTYALDALDAQTLGIAPGLKIIACPFDTFSKISWMTTPGGGEVWCAYKDYEMVSSGEGNSYQGANNLIQRATKNGLPSTTTPGFLGVGIYWEDTGASTPNWNPPGFPETVVRHPSGTIMLAEEAGNQNAEGNIWPCICCGPICARGDAWGALYQIDTRAPQDAQSLASGGALSEGQLLYRAQHNRFNYAFHDGHVELLPYTKTMNPGGVGAVQNLTVPNGMWNVNTAD
jgi:prepilin-type N-terminal cleavage/methylation domain-containing protein/prepilin-type processing-associated H-X9-DG protein